MSGLAGLLAGRDAPGLWRWESNLDVDDVRTAVEGVGWSFAHLDGAAVESKHEFLVSVGRALAFPETYGTNFDALADLLDDVGEHRGTVLLWDAWAGFARAEQRWFPVALTVLRERCADAGRSPFAVLLRGPGPELPDVPLLD